MPVSAALVLAAALSADPGVYVDVTRATGLDFVYQNGMSGGLHLPEIMGGGVALFDFDNDGDLDVYLVQGGRLGAQGEPSAGALGDRLWRNDLSGGRLSFVDISDSVGLAPAGYGMGAAAGDYDGDGWTDVLVTGYGLLRLLRNQEGRRLQDVTSRAGVADDGWSVSATFFDYDRDGRLDLYVARYVSYEPVRCVLPSTRPDYCGPKSYTAQRDRLFHNRGDGTFEDVSATRLGAHKLGAGLGVVATDLDGDGWIDLYVANDGSDNHLWRNRAGRGFEDDGLLGGVALSRAGIARGGMGTDAADVDEDGRPELFVANLMGESHGLYVNRGSALFEERGIESGIAAASATLTGFGARFLDYDNDGRLDLVVVSGSVHLRDTPVAGAGPQSLGQPKLLLHNLGQGRFGPVAAAPFEEREVSRGLGVGDLDNDGDPDLVVVNNLQPARVLLDRVGQKAAWLGLRLVTRDGKCDAFGARATLSRRGAPDLVRDVRADGSYASAGDPRLLFGLGRGHDLVALDVRWPDGVTERFAVPPAGRYTTLRQGASTP